MTVFVRYFAASYKVRKNDLTKQQTNHTKIIQIFEQKNKTDGSALVESLVYSLNMYYIKKYIKNFILGRAS